MSRGGWAPGDGFFDRRARCDERRRREVAKRTSLPVEDRRCRGRADGLEMRVSGIRWLAFVAEQVRDDLEAVCGVLKTETLAREARQMCL